MNLPKTKDSSSFCHCCRHWELCSQLAAQGNSLISTFISCQCFSVHLSDCSVIGKYSEQNYFGFPISYLSLVFSLFFSLNNLLLVNETSCYLGKGRIGHDFQPSVCASACQHNNLFKFGQGFGCRRLIAGAGHEIPLVWLFLCDLEFKFRVHLLM